MLAVVKKKRDQKIRRQQFSSRLDEIRSHLASSNKGGFRRLRVLAACDQKKSIYNTTARPRD
jgi:hypothetical protein